jgi:hypothetical protein
VRKSCAAALGAVETQAEGTTMVKRVVLFLMVSLLSLSVSAQEPARKVDTNLIALLNSIDSATNRVMEVEKSEMDFARWQDPAGVVEAAKERFQTQKVSVDALHAIIAKIKSQRRVSSIRLFGLYGILRDVEGSISDLATLANIGNPASSLASDLMQARPELTSVRGKLSDSVDRSMQLDSSDLVACNKARGNAKQ